MAVELIETDAQKKAKEAAQKGVSGASSTGAAPGSVTIGGGASVQSPSASQQALSERQAGPRQGTGFTGVGRYLQASSSGNLGQQVAKGVAQAGQQAASGLSKAVGQFEGKLGQQRGQFEAQRLASQRALQRIASGAVPMMPIISVPEPSPTGGIKAPPGYRIDGILSQPRSRDGGLFSQPGSRDGGLFSQPRGSATTQKTMYAGPSPDYFLNPSQEEMGAYAAISGGQYEAPTGLEDIEAVAAQARTARQMAEATQTAKGRQGLLQQTFGQGTQQYTKGQSALDTLILGRSENQLAQARKGSIGLGRQIESGERLAQEKARQFGADVQAAKQSAVETESKIKGDIASAVSGQRSSYEKELERLYGKIGTEIASGTISQDTADVLRGLGFDPSTALYNINKTELGNLLTRKGVATDASSITPEQLYRLSALSKLGGKEGAITQEQLAEAGTTSGTSKAKSGIVSTRDLSKYAAEKRGAYEQILGTLLPGYTGMGSIDPGKISYKQGAEYKDLLDAGMTKFQRAFSHSGSGGKTYINQDLMKAVASGKLYDPKTGRLNQTLASQLKDFWDTRKGYMGRGGILGWGSGKYERQAAEDDPRVAALKDLISGMETLKVQ